MNLPSDYGIDIHAEWRTNQLESVEWVLAKQGYTMLEAPVGSGKSAIVTAVANRGKKSISVCLTKLLQSQYEMYKWNIVKGKSNYPCVHADVPDDATAEDCLYPDNMRSCEYISDCEYHRMKIRALSSSKINCNYALWLTSRYLKEWEPEYVCLDEAHGLPDIVLNWTGIQIDLHDLREWNLPWFPDIESDRHSLFAINNSTNQAKSWLEACSIKVSNESNYKALNMPEPEKKKYLDRAEKFMHKIGATLAGLYRNESDWYIKSGREVTWDGKPGFICKPLTARHHFNSLFNHAENITLMSATIGNAEVFANELGIERFEFRTVESSWHPSTRPIHVLDAPKMGNGSTRKDPKAFDKQADVIAEFIKEYPKDWSGLILVTRKTEAVHLAERLSERGLYGRIWPFPDKPTDIQLQKWEQQKSRYKGQIGVSWSTWEGYDGQEEKILVIAKCPFPQLGKENSYERSRMLYDPKFYRLETGLKLEQGAGRIRRGEKRDYDTDGEVRKAVAIADADIRTIDKYLSQGFKDSLVGG